MPPERPRPDLQQVRDALRERDDRSEPPEPPPEPPEPPAPEVDDERDSGED
jgi:hypothetical protein